MVWAVSELVELFLNFQGFVVDSSVLQWRLIYEAVIVGVLYGNAD